jgi:hypothetical protein
LRRLGADRPRRSVTVDHWIARAFCRVRAFLRGPQTCDAASENPQHSAFRAMTVSRAQRDAIRSTTASLVQPSSVSFTPLVGAARRLGLDTRRFSGGGEYSVAAARLGKITRNYRETG